MPGGPREWVHRLRYAIGATRQGWRTERPSARRPAGKEGMMTNATSPAAGLPDTMVSAKKLFGFDTDLEVPAY